MLCIPAGFPGCSGHSSSSSGIELGDEYTSYERGGSGASSGASNDAFTRALVLYLPNRLLDFIDVFRVDVGAGPAIGAVVRITEYGQMGYREFFPLSVRFGLRARQAPVFIEDATEKGFGPNFMSSLSREISPIELGLGGDLLLLGAYLGLSVDEAFDFLTGIIGFDIKGDDLE